MKFTIIFIVAIIFATVSNASPVDPSGVSSIDPSVSSGSNIVKPNLCGCPPIPREPISNEKMVKPIRPIMCTQVVCPQVDETL